MGQLFYFNERRDGNFICLPGSISAHSFGRAGFVSTYYQAYTKFWEVVAHENIGWKQIFSLIIILTGVYFANRTGKVIAVAD